MGRFRVRIINGDGTYTETSASQKLGVVNYLEGKKGAWMVEYGVSGYIRQYGKPFVESFEELIETAVPDTPHVMAPWPFVGVVACEDDALTISVHGDIESEVANNEKKQEEIIALFNWRGQELALMQTKAKRKRGVMFSGVQTAVALVIGLGGLLICAAAIPAILEYNNIQIFGG